MKLVMLCLAIAACGGSSAPVTPDAAPVMPDAAPSCDLTAGTYQQSYVLTAGAPPFCQTIPARQVTTSGAFAAWAAPAACDAGCTCNHSQSADACQSTFAQHCPATGVDFSCSLVLAGNLTLTGSCTITYTAPSANIGVCAYDVTVAFLHS